MGYSRLPHKEQMSDQHLTLPRSYWTVLVAQTDVPSGR